MEVHVCNLILFKCNHKLNKQFHCPFFFIAFAYFTLQPGDTTVPLNPMNNVTFNCTCSICINRPLFWTLTNNGVSLATNDNADQAILDQRGITYNSDINTAVLIIPSTTENNDTQIACKGIQNPANIIETSNPVMLTIIGKLITVSMVDLYPFDIKKTNDNTALDASLDLPADPMLRIISSSQVEIRWEIPNSHELFRLQGYNIEIVNGSSGDVLQILQDYNETSYVYTFEDDVQYCQILTVNVTAVADLGSSVPRSISRGFPIGEISTNKPQIKGQGKGASW